MDSFEVGMAYTGLLRLLVIVTVLAAFKLETAHAQAQGALLSNKDKFQLFSNEYSYQDDLLSDVEQGNIGAVWRTRLYGEALEFETQSAQVGTVDFFLESKYRMLRQLEALVFLKAKFQSGRSQDFFGDIEPQNGVLLREGALKYTPIQQISFKAGVINQDWLNMPQLVWRQSFPGASARLTYQWNENFETSFASQFLIPTSRTLSTRTVGREPTPTFSTHTLSGNWNKGDLDVVASASWYQFGDLPSFVAFESQKRGNSLLANNGPNNSVFLFDFSGWNTFVTGTYRVNSLWEPVASYSVMKNEKAPDTYNTAQLISVGSRFHTENFIYYAGYENYFAESDVAPAFYNSAGYGNTNREGYGFDTFVQLKKYNFRIRAQYYKAKVLNPDGLQEDSDYIYLGVETGYDRI